MRFSTCKFSFLAGPAGCLMTAALALVCFASTSSANDGITSDAIIQRAGLTIDWFTHSGVGVTGKLVDWQINVDENKPTTYFTITAGRYHEKFSQNTLSPFGTPYGVEKAREYAQVRTDILKAEFANDGITDLEVKVAEYTLPQSTVYTLTTNGVAKAIDADSGEIKWSSLVGDPSMPSIGIGANNKFVAAVNGSILYCLESESGKILWSAKCSYPASASPSVSDEKIYVPLINGRLEVFELDKEGVNSHAFVAKGRGTARPVITDVAVAWPTSQGNLNVAARYGKRPGVAYQLRSDEAIVSPPAFKDGIFYVTSLDGFIYAVDEELGVIVWQVSTGHGISQPPITLGNFVFAINDQHEMFKMHLKTGFNAKGWELPHKNVQRFVGAGKENMYLTDDVGNLMVMSQDSGAILSKVTIGGIQSILPNVQNDRLYVVSNKGMIQCIREISSPIPHFHANELVGVEVDPAQAKPTDDGSDQAKPDATDLDDPFGGNSQPAADADNPFGGAQPDPAKADAGDDNPFSGNGKSGSDATPPDVDDPFK